MSLAAFKIPLFDEIMPLAAIWIDLEIIILSEVNQTKKDKYRIKSPICGI